MNAKRKKGKYSLKQYENPRDERQELLARKVYWVIRCAAKGCLIGTNGKRLTRNCGLGTVMWFVIDLIEPIEALVRGDREFFIVNGALPTNCCSLSARCCSPSAESLCCGAFIGKMSGTGGKRNEYEIFR